MYINRTIKCLKRLQKRSIDNNLRQLFTRDSGIFFFFFAFPKIWVGRTMGNETFYGNGLIDIRSNNNLPSSVFLEWFHDLRQPWTGLQSEYQAIKNL